MKQILKLNAISHLADENLPKGYTLTEKPENPVGAILRSFDMHGYDLPKSVLAVARAGAGVNNIPIDEYASRGVVVFNTPGANANAVKELVLCALLLAGRKIVDGIKWAGELTDNVAKSVEKGKSSFVGGEIMGKKLGLIGLGAIGSLVANAAVDLGMTVSGYDPFISIDAAWHISNLVGRQTDINVLLAESDYISLHVPFNAQTKGMINAETIQKMKDGVAIVNCSRAELVDTDAILEAVKSGKVSRYVTDFPVEGLIGVENIITIPHLGASTPEAEDNCAVMAATQLGDYIENGNIKNSVNFPDCILARTGQTRLAIIHRNVKNVINQITFKFSNAGINIGNMLSRSKGDYAYTLFELDDAIDASTLKELESVGEIVRIRCI